MWDLSSLNAARHRRHRRHHHRAEGTSRAVRDVLVPTAAASAATAVWGFVDAYRGMPQVGGIDLDLVVGGVGTLFNLYSKMKGRSLPGGALGTAAVEGVSIGSFCYWAGKQGNLYGAKKRQDEKASLGAGQAQTTWGTPEALTQTAGNWQYDRGLPPAGVPYQAPAAASASAPFVGFL